MLVPEDVNITKATIIRTVTLRTLWVRLCLTTPTLPPKHTLPELMLRECFEYYNVLWCIFTRQLHTLFYTQCHALPHSLPLGESPYPLISHGASLETASNYSRPSRVKHYQDSDSEISSFSSSRYPQGKQAYHFLPCITVRYKFLHTSFIGCQLVWGVYYNLVTFHRHVK